MLTVKLPAGCADRCNVRAGFARRGRDDVTLRFRAANRLLPTQTGDHPRAEFSLRRFEEQLPVRLADERSGSVAAGPVRCAVACDLTVVRRGWPLVSGGRLVV